MTVSVKKLDDRAKLPTRATPGSAGYDLYACIGEPMTLPPLGCALIPTGIAISLPSAQFAAFIYARSGLAIRHGIALLNGVGIVDSDYRGEIKVGVINLSHEAYVITPQERIAQMVIGPVAQAQIEEVSVLEDTDRGAGGFGSTGKK